VSSNPPFPPPGPAARASIPHSLFPVYKKLLHPKPTSRLRLGNLHRLGMEISIGEGGGFFADNKLVKFCVQLDGLPLASDSEKVDFLQYVILSSVYRSNVQIIQDN
jgi:SCY1-like protein 1